MNPLTAGLDIAGMGLQIWGGFKAAETSRQMSEVSKGIAADEQQINAQKYQQMQLEATRMQLQQFRNIQRLRSQATAAAVNQGAQYGTGLQGGLAQIMDQGLENVRNTSQNVEIGKNIFNINNDISGKKMQMADLQSQLASDQALSSLGGALVKNAGTVGDLGKDGLAFFSSFGA